MPLLSDSHYLNWYFIDLMMNHICLNVDLNCFIAFRYVNVLLSILVSFFLFKLFVWVWALVEEQVLLGGRAAEEVIYGRDTSKASIDYLADASWLARKILTMLAWLLFFYTFVFLLIFLCYTSSFSPSLLADGIWRIQWSYMVNHHHGGSQLNLSDQGWILKGLFMMTTTWLNHH